MSAGRTVKNFRFPPLPTIRDIIKLFNLKAQRQLSQNFLLNPALNNKLIKCCGSLKGVEVCEVGPGPGNLTRSIISKGACKVHLIEKDDKFLPSLQMLSDAAPGMINVMKGDVLRFDMMNLFSEERRKTWDDIPPSIHLIGNLPFNIATPLIIKWLRAISEKNNAWSFGRVKMTLTFQKEVAERIEAPIMTTSRCRLSVMCQNWCDVQLKLIIPGKAFLPKPKVDVGVVHFVPRIDPIIPLRFELVEKIVRAVFLFRKRKVIRGLQSLFPKLTEEEMAQTLLNKADINPELRSFQLSIQEIGKICSAFQSMADENPHLMKYQRSSESSTDWIAKERESEQVSKKFHENLVFDDFY